MISKKPKRLLFTALCTVNSWFMGAIFILLFVSSCGEKVKNVEDTYKNKDQIVDKKSIKLLSVDVKTKHVQQEPFSLELVANGKLMTNKRADLRFQISGIILNILVNEGQQVMAGQLIGELDNTEQESALRQSTLDYRKAQLDYEDQLLRLGYRLADSASLDVNVKNTTRLRSGLANAEINLQRAKKHLAETKLYSPFTGKIANLKAKKYNSTGSDPICTLIDDQKLIAEFKVLEQEIPFIKNTQGVVLTAFSLPDKSYQGSIVSINPLVDEGGMVTVKANVSNTGSLLDGMSVRIVARRIVDRFITVPKEAVLDRQGRKVVFTLLDSIAKWNYVEIAHENSTHYAIASGLKPNDEVIYDGNFNLAHDKKVDRIN